MFKRTGVAILCSYFAVYFFTSLTWSQEPKRPYYEHPGNYRDEINQLKVDFKNRFRYDLIDLEHEWRPWEINKLVIAFSKLPDTFLKIKGFKG